MSAVWLRFLDFLHTATCVIRENLCGGTTSWFFNEVIVWIQVIFDSAVVKLPIHLGERVKCDKGHAEADERATLHTIPHLLSNFKCGQQVILFLLLYCLFLYA